jgi:two-component system phosphate regulon response regulator OmpR
MMSDETHIVVVDDETDVRETLEEYLVQQGYRVTALPDGQELRRLVAEEQPFDIALLDVTMPGEDGLSLARFLRESVDAGIIMVTASGETVDRIVGLEMGADDYIPKPVDLRELKARIKAVLRRATSTRGAIPPEDPEHHVVAFGQCQLDLDAHKLFDEDGKEIALTAMEFDLLKAFAERPNRVLTRDQLLELAHNRGWEPFDRSIDIRIARIRRKIETDPGKPQVIKTVRGAGYMFSTSSS